MSEATESRPAWLEHRERLDARPVVGDRVEVHLNRGGNQRGIVLAFNARGTRVQVRLNSGTVIERRLPEIRRASL